MPPFFILVYIKKSQGLKREIIKLKKEMKKIKSINDKYKKIKKLHCEVN